MYKLCHIPPQDVIESDRIKKQGSKVAINLSMHFLCGRSPTRWENAGEICNLDLDLDLDLAEIWISLESNQMLI